MLTHYIDHVHWSRFVVFWWLNSYHIRITFLAWVLWQECRSPTNEAFLGNWATVPYIDCLVQDSSNSIAYALELLQSCTKPSIYSKLIMEGKLIIQHKQNEPVCMSHGTYCAIRLGGVDTVTSRQLNLYRGLLNIKTVLPCIGCPIIIIRRPWDRLIFMMGISQSLYFDI